VTGNVVLAKCPKSLVTWGQTIKAAGEKGLQAEREKPKNHPLTRRSFHTGRGPERASGKRAKKK